MDYLKSYSITEELCVFVEHVSLDKEQRLYMKWLSVVDKFINDHWERELWCRIYWYFEGCVYCNLIKYVYVRLYM